MKTMIGNLTLWMTIMKMHSKYHSWSLLDPKPICFYDKTSGEDLAVWNGIYMTRNQAMMIACEKYLGVWATPTMKQRAWQHFLRAYYSNAFGHKDWDGTIQRINHGSEHYHMLKSMMTKHLSKMQEYQPHEVLAWFNYHKERKEWIQK